MSDTHLEISDAFRPQMASLARFCVVGVGVTLIHVLVAWGLIARVGYTPMTANIVAFICATSCSYFANTYWSFRRPATLQSLRRFVSVSLVGCALSAAISGFADHLELSYWVGIAAVVCAVPIISFIGHSIWTFNK